MVYFKNMKNKIEFISTIEGLEEIEECKPKPAKHFIPKWYKDIPNIVNKDLPLYFSDSHLATAKMCPSFPDYFSQGYIIPMWSDAILHYDKETLAWHWKTNLSKWDAHPNAQFIDHVEPYYQGFEGNFIFKTVCPWRIVTPPGWSVFQLPLFYHFNPNFSVLPGIIDTDVHSEINQQVLYHSKEDTITIDCGDPFVLYIPFKRNSKLEMSIRYQTEEDKKMFAKQYTKLQTKINAKGLYRKLQRLRDKDDR